MLSIQLESDKVNRKLNTQREETAVEKGYSDLDLNIWCRKRLKSGELYWKYQLKELG